MLSRVLPYEPRSVVLHPPTPEQLREALAAHTWVEHPALPGRTNHRRAGVLVPLLWDGPKLSTLLQLRPRTLKRHGGEVSFPGGRVEPEDVDLEHTARREAHEELGLRDLDVLGRLSSMPVYTSDFRLEPFVAVARADEIAPDPGEVAQVLPIDLMDLLRAPSLESIQGLEIHPPLPLFRADDWVIFGATALTLLELLGVVAETVGAPIPPYHPTDIEAEMLFRHGAAVARVKAAG
jgi:8-oxo-dGTP pyrophosphatase MutT (NUDIX family)